MRTAHLSALAFALALVAACASPREPQLFGAPLVLSRSMGVPVAELLSAPERYDGTTLAVVGTVAEVCAKKGCWMTLRGSERELRVTFQDYGFFVPLDSRGAQVRAEGLFRIEQTPVAEARHYLEDAGKHAEALAITAPVKSYTLVATGVELVRP